MSLYTEVRPQTLDAMRGNETAIESVRAAFESENHNHNYLFHGPSGTGKTTMARAIAKELLGVEDLNIREINSSDNRGIDTARDIINEIKFLPAMGGKVVYIIDEVHKATNDWQNAMLKPLEDTPSHVYFFLCTTEPNKLVSAMKTRLTKVALKSLKPEELFKLVRVTAKQKGFDIPKEILEELSECSQGSPRQALVYLEQISSMTDPSQMRRVFQGNSESELKGIELCRILLRANTWKEIADVLTELKGSEEPESLRRAVLGYMQSILLKKDNPKAAVLMDCFADNLYDTGFPGLVLQAYQAFDELQGA